MVEHVRRRACLCRGFSEVAVATCDEEIARAVRGFGGQVVMTSPDHPAATDRVAEAARKIDCTHVVNVQGDEVLVLPADLERMARGIRSEPDAPAWNAMAHVERAGELSDPSVVKCGVSVSSRILFCARDLSHLAGTLKAPWEGVRRILGILGYRKDFLERYLTMGRTPLERAESIDQFRILEHDVPLRGILFHKGYLGINESRELPVVRCFLEKDPLQQAVLQDVLAG